jgi:pimeloyl-ACP methyl ester carboxylesterase
MGAQGQAQLANSKGTDTLNTKVVPVVLVPGVMGSRLDIATTSADWDPDDKIEMGGWLKKRRRSATNDMFFSTPATLMTDLIGAAGTRPSTEIFDRPRLRQIAQGTLDPKLASRARPSAEISLWESRGWGEVSWGFYGPILMDMEERLNPGDQGGEMRPVYSCGYDWRQSNQTSAIALRARLKQILAKHPLAKQVILVTHSMGGLVARAALTQGAQSDILGIVHNVIPADGAVVAYRRFFTGAQGGLHDDPFALNLIMGGNRVQYAIMQSGLRGPTELLPSNSYPDAFFQLGAGITNKFVDVYQEYPKQVPPGMLPTVGESEGKVFTNTITAADIANLRTRIREADAFTASIANVFHPNTFVLFGDENVTDVMFDFRLTDPKLDGTGKDPRVIQLPQGDGTVPRASARFEACTALGRNGAKVRHAECFGVPSFRDAVIDRIRRLLALVS